MSAGHPLISLRLGRGHLEPALLTAHLAMIARHRGACDEVWLATSMGFPPLEVVRDHAARMAAAAARVRGAGIAASLQISNTLGHGRHHAWNDLRGLEWGRMVGADGTRAPTCCCPRDPAFLRYLDVLTRAFCAWQPDRVWIDDDLRMNQHSPATYGCFCERCVAEFADAVGRGWGREELVAAINHGNDLSTRAAWIEHCRRSLAGVARTVATAAGAVAPDAAMGFQHAGLSWAGYNGPDWNHVYRALHEASGRGVGSRPGHGFYNDHQPRRMLDKAMAVCLQNERKADCVEVVTYECENLPGTVLGKSAHGTAVECTLAIAHGCDGISLTSLQFPHETDWHERMLATFEAWRPFWQRCATALRGGRNAGVRVFLSRGQAARRLEEGEKPFAWASTHYGELFGAAAAVGLPLCWNPEAPAALLAPTPALGVGEGELRELVARGLIIDGQTLEVLHRRGMAEALGLRLVPPPCIYNRLELSDDPVNGRHGGSSVVCCGYMFARRPARSVEVIRGKARVLSRYADVEGEPAGAEAVLVEHEDGGRVAFFGWGVDCALVNTGRRHQVLEAADWVAHGRLPVRLSTACQVALVPRCDSRGRLLGVLLLNISLDPTPELRLIVRDHPDAGWIWTRPGGDDLALPAADEISLPPLSPWSPGVLLAAD
jgi:hypothetical protein